MIFSAGQKVRFIFTGDLGVIERLEGDLAQVRLEDGDLIPVPLENLESATAASQSTTSSPSTAYQGPIPIDAVDGFQPGIHLIFNLGKQQGPFEFGLLNLTSTAGLISSTLAATHHPAQTKNTKVAAFQYVPLGLMPFNWLGDSASFSLEAWPNVKEGTGKKITGKVRIKAQNFFDHPLPIEDLGEANFKSYLMLRDWIPAKEKEGQDLRAYTKSNLDWDKFDKIMDTHEVAAKATFATEIDLHIETLTEHHQRLDKVDILRTQVLHFERYMAEAIKVGIDRVFIIHGLGKGRLRQEIHARLSLYPQVSSFKNDYHPSFGWGATEVNFG